MSHTSFGKSLSPPPNVAILAKTNALEKVERLEKLERIGGRGEVKITFASVEDVGNG